MIISEGAGDFDDAHSILTKLCNCFGETPKPENVEIFAPCHLLGLFLAQLVSNILQPLYLGQSLGIHFNQPSLPPPLVEAQTVHPAALGSQDLLGISFADILPVKSYVEQHE